MWFDVDLQSCLVGIRWEVLGVVASRRMWWELPDILLVMVSILEGERAKKRTRETKTGPLENDKASWQRLLESPARNAGITASLPPDYIVVQ